VYVCGVSATAVAGIGDRLTRGYGTYATLPVNTTQARSLKWSSLNESKCNPSLGIAWTYDKSGPTSSYPITIYYTPYGQAAGIAINIYGEPKGPPRYFKKLASGIYQISISFRNLSVVCDRGVSTMPLGDQLVINQDTAPVPIPVYDKDLVGNWTKGSCFDTMGTHWFYDVTSGGKPLMSWQAANLLPIIPMYYGGRINALFFSSSDVQQGILSSNMWDIVPLPGFLMCKNWCDNKCTWKDTNFWSTSHIYFNDEKKVICGGGCTRSCCPGFDRRADTAEEADWIANMPHMHH